MIPLFQRIVYSTADSLIQAICLGLDWRYRFLHKLTYIHTLQCNTCARYSAPCQSSTMWASTLLYSTVLHVNITSSHLHHSILFKCSCDLIDCYIIICTYHNNLYISYMTEPMRNGTTANHNNKIIVINDINNKRQKRIHRPIDLRLPVSHCTASVYSLLQSIHNKYLLHNTYVIKQCHQLHNIKSSLEYYIYDQLKQLCQQFGHAKSIVQLYTLVEQQWEEVASHYKSYQTNGNTDDIHGITYQQYIRYIQQSMNDKYKYMQQYAHIIHTSIIRYKLPINVMEYEQLIYGDIINKKTNHNKWNQQVIPQHDQKNTDNCCASQTSDDISPGPLSTNSRPINSFIKFVSIHRKYVSSTHVELTFTEIAQLLANKWKSFTDEQKQYYSTNDDTSYLQPIDTATELADNKNDNITNHDLQSNPTINTPITVDSSAIDMKPLSYGKSSKTTAYLHYVAEQKLLFSHQSTTSIPFRQFAQQCGEQWRLMNNQQKIPYYLLAYMDARKTLKLRQQSNNQSINLSASTKG